eukprot:60313-Chlamydomonas_euryale.AAC.1
MFVRCGAVDQRAWHKWTPVRAAAERAARASTNAGWRRAARRRCRRRSAPRYRRCCLSCRRCRPRRREQNVPQ